MKSATIGYLVPSPPSLFLHLFATLQRINSCPITSAANAASPNFLNTFFNSHAQSEMGNICTCMPSEEEVKRRNPRRLGHNSTSSTANSSNLWTRIRSSSRRDNSTDLMEDPVIREQALAAAAIILQQHQQNDGGSLPFDRSTSLRYPPGNNSKKHSNLPRSSSTRPRSLIDPLLQPHQLVSQESKLEGLETNHFVLVHGGGFGAWCWYKTTAFLEEAGFKVSPIDLTGSGIHSSDASGITSLSQYVKPLTDFLEKLADCEKVILVGHDFGGACISYAMELYPSKISKAVFVAATMLTNGQSTIDIFSQQTDSNGLMQQAQIFLYGNGKDHPPTAFDLDKSLLRDLLFNQSPDKDVALASVCMRRIPFAPVLEKLTLTDQNYGTVRRFYIETPEDNAIPVTLQEHMVSASPPEQVFRLKGADHSPFFSKPQALHKHLLEVAKISST